MRTASIERITTETTVKIDLSLDELEPVCDINTGIGFLDHMLILLARHSRIGLSVQVKGDLFVDGHHTTEDVGIVLGQCLKIALGDKVGINRYGNEYVPMDETLGFAVVDLSGRSYLVFNAEFDNPKVGDFETELVEEFFQAVAFNAEMNLHLNVLYGRNTHHKIESLFKAFGRALRQAIDINPEIKGVNSTKGIL